VWFAWLGETEGALTELEASCELRNPNLLYTAVDPAFRGLHAQPRFQAVLRKMGLGGQPTSAPAQSAER